MKILRTLPFVVAALSTIWGSAIGEPPSLLWVWAVFCTLIAAVVSPFGYTDPRSSWGAWEVEERPRTQRRRRIIIGLSLAVIFSVATLHWPLRACFWLSQPALENMARQASQGSLATPQRVGPFTITDVTCSENQIVLWMDGHNQALVRTVAEEKPRPSGEDVDLDSQWYFYNEI